MYIKSFFSIFLISIKLIAAFYPTYVPGLTPRRQSTHAIFLDIRAYVGIPCERGWRQPLATCQAEIASLFHSIAQKTQLPGALEVIEDAHCEKTANAFS